VLNRQRALLAILGEFKESIAPIALVKLAFLASVESDLQLDHTFYEFVPYHYGPFSFALYRELSTLRDYGYVMASHSAVALNDRLRTEAFREMRAMPASALASVRKIVARYGSRPANSLVAEVYARYPWFASRSRLVAPPINKRLPAAAAAIYTVGYGSTSIDGFLALLLRAGIERIIDVRANPVSRKYGFAKRTLQRVSGKLDIAYAHVPELGIHGSERRELTSPAAYTALFERYSSSLPGRAAFLEQVRIWMEEKPSVLLCMEAEATSCHRKPLAEAIARNSDLPIQHLVE
jgi:uncharacterized protein (DUF488 family)